MQRVELLVWRDFVKLIRRTPNAKVQTIADKLGIERCQAIEYMVFYRQYNGKEPPLPTSLALLNMRKRHPMPVDNMQVGDKVELPITSLEDARKVRVQLHNRVKSIRRYEVLNYTIACKTVGDKLIVERIS